MDPSSQYPTPQVTSHQTQCHLREEQMVAGAQSGSSGQRSEGCSGLERFPELGQMRATRSRDRTRAVSMGCVEMGISRSGDARR